MTFFTAAVFRAGADRFLCAPVYPKCAGKLALPTCPLHRICEKDNTPRALLWPLAVISGYDNRPSLASIRGPNAC
jgi:hypothetical protein